jgi:CBS-domain-containing membrane protein
MGIIGWLLTASGLVLVAVGIAILTLGAIQLWRQMFKPAAAAAQARTLAGPAVNLADLTKLIEAIIKIPQWLLAVLAGDAQIYLGYWLVTGNRLF